MKVKTLIIAALALAAFAVMPSTAEARGHLQVRALRLNRAVIAVHRAPVVAIVANRHVNNAAIILDSVTYALPVRSYIAVTEAIALANGGGYAGSAVAAEIREATTKFELAQIRSAQLNAPQVQQVVSSKCDEKIAALTDQVNRIAQLVLELKK